MSESSFRRVARTGLAPLMEDVPDGPEWTDLTPETALAPSRSARFGWLAGVGAAVVVLVVIGVTAFLTGEDPVPPPATGNTEPGLAEVFQPPTRTVDGETFLDLTLLDGSQITLAYPADIDLTSKGVEAEAVGGVGAVNRSVITRYGPPEGFIAQNEANQGPGKLTNTFTGPDGRGVERWDFPDIPYLVFDFSPWTAYVWDTKFGVSELAEGWAHNLHGTIDANGFLVLTADPPLELVDAADDPGPDGPDIRVDGESGALLVFINDCDRMTRLEEETYGNEGFAFCDEPTNTLFFIFGDADVQERIHTSLRVNPDVEATTTTRPEADQGPLIAVTEMREPRPVDPDLAASPDWTFLPSDPLSPRWPLVTAWTGKEIVVLGGELIGGGEAFQDGAAYNVSTQEWRSIPPGPFTLDNEEEWVWTGDELIIWGQGRAMAWNPLTNSWRLMDDWPLNGGPYQEAVWTGSLIIDVAQGLAVDPVSGVSTPIAEPPHLGERSTAVWTGTHAVIVTGEGSYNAATDTWVDMPGLSGLTDLATSGTAVEGKVVAGDYELRAATYHPESNSWTELPDLPLRFFECAPTMHSVGEVPIFEHCSGWAALVEDAWIPYSYPIPDLGWALIPAGPDLFAWGEAGLATLTIHDAFTANADLRRIPAGIASLDVPDGWSATQVTTAQEDISTSLDQVVSQDVLIDLETPTGLSCTVIARHALVEILLAQYTIEGTKLTEVQPYVGGTAYPALENTSGLLDTRHHLTWPVGTSDLIDASCDDPTMTRVLAERIWAPYQILAPEADN